jgi:hypothetical protein
MVAVRQIGAEGVEDGPIFSSALPVGRPFIYLAWLATGTEQCRAVDIRVLCGIFNTSVEDVMQYYRVKDCVNKSEHIARIQTTAGRLQ